MGFLSKLLGAKDPDEALGALKNAARNVLGNAVNAQPAAQRQNTDHPGQQTAYAPQPHAARAGDSWGDEMPAEENQFSFAGSYIQYFETVFREDFPAYRVSEDRENAARKTAFTLWNGDRKALVVEVMSERCSSRKLRRSAEAEGVPYLRFYFDHHGWWNTRSYVAGRIRRALNG